MSRKQQRVFGVAGEDEPHTEERAPFTVAEQEELTEQTGEVETASYTADLSDWLAIEDVPMDGTVLELAIDEHCERVIHARCIPTRIQHMGKWVTSHKFVDPLTGVKLDVEPVAWRRFAR